MLVAIIILILGEHSIIVSAGVDLLKPVELLLLFIIVSAEQLRLCKRWINWHLGVCQERTGTIQPIHLSHRTWVKVKLMVQQPLVCTRRNLYWHKCWIIFLCACKLIIQNQSTPQIGCTVYIGSQKETLHHMNNEIV